MKSTWTTAIFGACLIGLAGTAQAGLSVSPWAEADAPASGIALNRFHGLWDWGALAAGIRQEVARQEAARPDGAAALNLETLSFLPATNRKARRLLAVLGKETAARSVNAPPALRLVREAARSLARPDFEPLSIRLDLQAGLQGIPSGVSANRPEIAEARDGVETRISDGLPAWAREAASQQVHQSGAFPSPRRIMGAVMGISASSSSDSQIIVPVDWVPEPSLWSFSALLFASSFVFLRKRTRRKA